MKRLFDPSLALRKRSWARDGVLPVISVGNSPAPRAIFPVGIRHVITCTISVPFQMHVKTAVMLQCNLQ